MNSPSRRVRLQVYVTDYAKLVVCANLAGLTVHEQANRMIALGVEHTLRKWASVLKVTPEEVWRSRVPAPATEDEE